MIEIEMRLLEQEANVLENKLGQPSATWPHVEVDFTLTSNGLNDPPSNSKKLFLA